jgi:UrcA family protein
MNPVKSARRSSVWPVALASLACLLGSTQLLASAPVETRSVAIRYADLDLDSSQGAAELYHRIVGAARVVCGYAEHAPARLSQVRSCNSRAVSDAVAAVNAPLLSQIHNAHRRVSLTAMNE